MQLLTEDGLPLMSSEPLKGFLQYLITDYFFLETVTSGFLNDIFEITIFCKAALKKKLYCEKRYTNSLNVN